MTKFKYILEGHKAVLEPDLIKWAIWFEKADRQVGLTKLENDICISTVFMGLNHSFIDDRVPILFETMVFGGILNQERERYSTWQDAEEGHKRWVDKVCEREGITEVRL